MRCELDMDRETSGMPLRRELHSTVPCTADVSTRPLRVERRVHHLHHVHVDLVAGVLDVVAPPGQR